MSVGAGIDQYNALVGQTLSRGKNLANQSVPTGQTVTLVAPVGGSDVLTVEASMTGAASGDLGLQVFPYAADGVTVLGTPLPAVSGIGYAPTFATPNVAAVQQYNVQGIDKVSIQAKNNNAGTQPMNVSWRVENN